jgi:hypothetical protein
VVDKFDEDHAEQTGFGLADVGYEFDLFAA